MVEKIRRSSPWVVNLSEILLKLTNGVVCRAALGRRYDGAAEEGFGRIRQMLIELLVTFNLGNFVPWLGWINKIKGLDARVEKVFKLLDEFLGGVLRDCRERKVGSDAVVNFGDALIEFQREGKEEVEDDVLKALILVSIYIMTIYNYIWVSRVFCPQLLVFSIICC